MQFTHDQLAVALVDFVRSRGNSSVVKSIAKDLGYKLSFFKPGRKVRLFEELLYLNVALVYHEIDQAFEGDDSEAIARAFLQRCQETIFKALGDDQETDTRYHSRMNLYFDLLADQRMSMDTARAFVAFLYAAERPLPTSIAPVAGFIAESQEQLKRVLSAVRLSM